MATIINFSESKRRSFWRGFWKGVAAPVMLYSRFSMPPEARSIKTNKLPADPVGDLGKDWARVGTHLNTAFENTKRRRA